MSERKTITLGELWEMGDAVPPSPTAEPTEEHDNAVQAALYALAVGGKTWEDKVTGDGLVVRAYKRLPPSFQAVQLWLQSRRPRQWPKEFKVTHEAGATLEALILRSMAPAAQVKDERVVSEQ